MKRKILKAVALVIALCAILPALPAMARISEDAQQESSARKGEPVNPIEARKGEPVNPIEASKGEPVNPIE